MLLKLLAGQWFRPRLICSRSKTPGDGHTLMILMIIMTIMIILIIMILILIIMIIIVKK